MLQRFAIFIFALLGFVFICCARHAAFAQQPAATAPALTPLKAVCHEYDHISHEGPIEKLLAFYHAATPLEQKAARSLAQCDLAEATLEQALLEKFDRNSADIILHEMSSETLSDVDDAIENIEGDHATLDWQNGDDPLPFIKVDGKWKFAVTVLIKDMGAEQVNDLVKTNQQVADLATEVTRQLKAGKFKDFSALEETVKSEMKRINEQEDTPPANLPPPEKA